MNEITTSNFDLPNLQEMEMLMKYCEIVAKAPAYQAMGGMPGIFALVMTARELGIGPMLALNGGMYLIPPGVDKEGNPKGQPTVMMAAKTMSMMIWKAGHKIEEIECSDTQVILKGTRKDSGVSMTVTMNMAKARTAQLSHDGYGKAKLWSPWFKTPEDMLWKTCVAKLGRRLFTDVIGNAYEPAEFSEKEAIEKKPKQLKGKNLSGIEEKQKPLEIEYEDDKDLNNLQDFIREYKLDIDVEDRNDQMIEYIEKCAVKRGKTYKQMIEQCYLNKEAFLDTYSKLTEISVE